MQRHRSIVDVHVLLRRDGRVLFGRRANVSYGDGLLHLPSGHLEPGESVTAAACREALEELAIVIDPADVEFVHVMHRTSDDGPDRVGFFFAVDRWTGEPRNNEPDRCSELVWLDPADLPADVIAYPAAALRAASTGMLYSEFGWIGLPKGTVRVIGHRPEWTEAGERLVARLAEVLGSAALAVEHVGSTAVAGMPAKPILDIAIRLAPEVTAAPGAPDVVETLEAAGFEFRGDKGPDGGMLFVAEAQPNVRTAHIHVVPDADPQFERYLAVRDRLRSDPDAVRRYGVLKEELALRYPDDRAAYTRGKSEFLAELAGRGDGAAPG